MRVKRIVLLCMCIMTVMPLLSQHNPYEYYLGGSSSQYLESSRIEPDLTLFYSPLEGEDVFTTLSEYNFSAVRYLRRGYDFQMGKVYFGNLDISNPHSQYPDYSMLSAIRRSRLPRSLKSGLTIPDAGTGTLGGVEEFVANPAAASQGYRFGIFSYNRNGRLGANISGADRMGRRDDKGLSFVYDLYLRNGKDANIDGVFTEEYSFALVPRYAFDRHTSLTFALFAGSSKRGLRSSATKEAFGLTEDNFYNPSWGYFDGKVRNARVRSETPLMAAALFNTTSGRMDVDISLSYVGSKSAYTALSWFDADTPYPDYYRDMPSYLGDTPTADYVREQWLSGNASVTQVDWARLYETNIYAGQTPVDDGGARYFLEDRIEKSDNLQLAVSGTLSDGRYSKTTFGFRLKNDNTHYYKELDDLLGGAPFLDADQYLADTVRYGGRWLNDMRNPDRLVAEGDTFGYNYRFISQRGEAFVTYRYANNRFRLNTALELAVNSLWRKGLFEKELNPGRESYGESETVKLETFAAKLGVGYSFSPKHMLQLDGMVADVMPLPGNLFVAPEYSNLCMDNPRTISIKSVEAQYTATFNAFMCRLAAFYTASSHESAIYAYYDDIEALYSDMLLTGISKRFYGLELGARYDFSSRLTLSLAATAGDFTYVSDPSVDIYEDASLEKYVSGSKSYMYGYRVGNTPQKAISAEIEYNIYGFIATLSFNYMADRYVVANPLRRMERIYNLTESPERFSEMVAQEKLPDAATVDLFLMKSFDMKHGSFTLLLSVNNLLGDRNMIYSGYEQMRIMRRGTGINRRYVPFDSKYLYSYPRSYYISATYRF